jgi:hypothetical protein
VEGHAWHSPATQVAKGESTTPNVRGQPPGGGNGKTGGNQPLAGAPTTAATAVAAGHGGKRPHQPSNSDDDSTKCLVHNSTHHTAVDYREIKKLAEQFREKMQQRQDGAPSRQREGKQKVDSQEQKDTEMEF